MYYFSLGTIGIFFGGSLFIYGNSILHRKYCIMCGKYPPCLSNNLCDATRLEGKMLRFLMKNISR
jgi:hypothetical protein